MKYKKIDTHRVNDYKSSQKIFRCFVACLTCVLRVEKIKVIFYNVLLVIFGVKKFYRVWDSTFPKSNLLKNYWDEITDSFHGYSPRLLLLN